jgi:hypothetical protein
MGFLRRVGREPPAAHVAPDRELEVPVEQRLPNRSIDLCDNALVEIEIVAGLYSIGGIRLRLFGMLSVGGRGHFFYRHAPPPNGLMAASSSFKSTRMTRALMRSVGHQQGGQCRRCR